MSKASNPTLIGAFVVGAIALLAMAVAIFGGTELFARKTVLVTYFDGSVKGLRPGSNVAFRGVRVGFVREIKLLTDIATLEPKIEVTMELLPSTMQVLRDGQPLEASLASVVTIDKLIDAGFSAQLGSESFVTGQLLVELDFRPDQPLQLYGRDPPHPEIPSVPSEIQQAIQRFQNLVADVEQNVDFAELSRRFYGVLQGFNELVNSQDLREALSGLNRLVNAEETQRLGTSLDEAVTELRGVIDRSSAFIDGLDTDVDTVVDDLHEFVGELRPAAASLNATLAEAEQTLRAARQQISGDSAQMYQLQSTLGELEAAAESMRTFFDYLERNPEALLRGKGK